jgi:hypothetical protein
MVRSLPAKPNKQSDALFYCPEGMAFASETGIHVAREGSRIGTWLIATGGSLLLSLDTGCFKGK